MKNNRICEIAKDLMPLVLDSAASEASRAFVDEHVAMCPDCAKIYREMRGAQPAAAAPEESDAAFGRSMMRIRKKRRVAAVLTSLLVVAAIATAGAIGYGTHAPHFTTVAGVLPQSELETRIARLPSGRVLVYAKALDETKRLGSDMCSLDPDGGANGVCFAVTAFTPTIISQWKPYRLVAASRSAFWLIDGQLYSIGRDIGQGEDGIVRIEKPDRVSAIRCEGQDGTVTLYQDGDDIPVLTQEEYLALRDELMCDWDDLLPGDYDEAPAYAEAGMEVVRNGGESTDRVTVVYGDPTLPAPVGSTPSEPGEDIEP